MSAEELGRKLAAEVDKATEGFEQVGARVWRISMIFRFPLWDGRLTATFP